MIESLKKMMEKDFVFAMKCEGDGRVMRRRKVLKYVEDIEREVKEHYIKVPLDRDGVPICLGDMVVNDYEDVPKRVVFLKVHSSGECTVGIVAEGEGAYVSQSHPCCLTHCKSLTAKDVIEGALNEAAMLDRKKGYWPSAADITNITDRVVKALGLKEGE